MYNTSDQSWTTGPEMPFDTAFAACGLVKTSSGRYKIVVVGGESAPGVAQNTAAAFDVVNGTWAAGTYGYNSLLTELLFVSYRDDARKQMRRSTQLKLSCGLWE